MKNLRSKGALLVLILVAALGLGVGVIYAQGNNSDDFQKQHQRMLPLFEIPGVVYTDAREDEDILEVGVVSKSSAPEIEKRVSQLGIPAAKVRIVQTQPIVALASLQDNVRPLAGGLQIAFVKKNQGYACTLGFNAVRAGVEGFVTNAHCTEKEGTVDGTKHYQPTVSTLNHVGTEVADPAYFTGGICPKGKKCRYSDSSFSQRVAGVTAAMGSIERTSGPNNGSLSITGSFNIVGESASNIAVGNIVNKVGRTTGWTQGNVISSCANVGVLGTSFVYLCQDRVQAGVGGGDSGSGVFKLTATDGQIELAGLLWGGALDGSSFTYSPIANLQMPSELGALSNCAAGYTC